ACEKHRPVSEDEIVYLRIRRRLRVLCVIRIIEFKHSNSEIATVFRRHRIYAGPAAVFRSEEKIRSIWKFGPEVSPSKIADRQVRVSLQTANFSRLPIHDKEPPLISLEASAGLRAPGEILSIRRIERRGVGSGTGGDFLGRVATDRHGENFVVRASRFDLVDVARVRDFLAVWRNRIHVLPA